MSLVPPEARWLVATQDWGPVLALPGWPPGCFLMASGAKSQVVMLLEAWGDSKHSGDSSTVAMNGRVTSRKISLPTSDRVGLGETGVVRDGFPRILCTSAGAVTGREPRRRQ